MQQQTYGRKNMARINLTGFTGSHKKGSNQKNVIGFSNLLKTLLEDQGHTADYGLENEDLNIVCVLDLSSINASNYIEALDTLRDKKSIIAFDDWNLKGFYKTLNNIVDNKKFSKTHHTVKYDELMARIDTLKDLRDNKYITIYPAYKTGDHDLLGITGEKYCIDPSIYIEKSIPETWTRDELMAVHASLAPKWSYLSKKKYSMINLRGVSEDKVFEYYYKYRIVMSPEHYFGFNAGWFRNRYALANIAGALIVEEPNSCFGESYNIERKQITEKTYVDLFEAQSAAYKETIMSKEEIKEALNTVLERVL